MRVDPFLRLTRGAISHATVAPLGASLLGLEVSGTTLAHAVTDGWPPWGAAGGVLLPWPNRVAQATWQLDGVPQHLEVTEPEHGNALHGLLLRTTYRVVHRSSASATLAAPVRPQPGYPFALDTSVRYDLLEQGLEVTHTVSNVGGRAAPVALGAHPYLCLGDAATGDLVLHIDAASHYRDDERHIVQEKVSTTGGPEDLTGGRRVGTGPRNTTYTDLALVDGYRRHRLVGPDGTSVELWADEAFSHVQVFSTTDVPGGSTTEVALAVEPMTAAPDAFNNGRGLRWLDPGRTWSVQWGLGHHGPASDAGAGDA